MYSDELLYQNFIRYENLYAITMRTFGATPLVDQRAPTRINIYIDAYSMLKVIYNIEPSMMGSITPSVIASSLINLAAHLRKYFLGYHGTWSTIYIVYGNNLPDDILCNPNNINYNISNRTKMEANDLASEKINSAFEILELLCPYIPEVYFYREKYIGAETASIIEWIHNYSCNSNNEFLPAIIYSRDTYMYQLVARLPRTFLYRPKKSNQTDVSFSVFKSNLFDAYRYNELKNKISSNTISINHGLFGLVLAYSGLKSRSIKSKLSFSSAYNTIAEIVNSNLIVNGYNSPSVIEMIKSQIRFGEEISNRYFLIDSDTRYLNYSQRPNSIENNLVDLNDPEAVKEINNMYFRRNPLDLQSL